MVVVKLRKEGLEGVLLFKIGANSSGNISEDNSGRWISGNEFINNQRFQFRAKKLGSLDEPVSFKAAGDNSTENKDILKYIGEEKAVRVQLDKYKAKGNLVNTKNQIINSNPINEGEREIKNTSIVPITNKELLDDSGNEILSLFMHT